MRNVLRKARRWIEWYAAQPVVAHRLRPGHRLLHRNGTVTVVRAVRSVPWPKDCIEVDHEPRGGQGRPGMRLRLTVNRQQILRLR